jgi:hypothetical protein
MTTLPGYRNLSHEEVALIRAIKSLGDPIESVITEIVRSNVDLDPRWLNIGRTHLQQGLMALTRAIAKPEGF